MILLAVTGYFSVATYKSTFSNYRDDTEMKFSYNNNFHSNLIIWFYLLHCSPNQCFSTYILKCNTCNICLWEDHYLSCFLLGSFANCSLLTLCYDPSLQLTLGATLPWTTAPATSHVAWWCQPGQRWLRSRYLLCLTSSLAWSTVNCKETRMASAKVSGYISEDTVKKMQKK